MGPRFQPPRYDVELYSSGSGTPLPGRARGACPRRASYAEHGPVAEDARHAVGSHARGHQTCHALGLGWQHQNDRCVSLRVGIIQSMSRKDSRLDNAATEPVFGHLENELFHGGW